MVVRQSRRQLAESSVAWLGREVQGGGAAAAGPSAAAAGGASTAKLSGEEGEGEGEEDLVEWPAAEQLLRQWYFRQGLWCARRPRLVLALSLAAVGLCALGLTRFRWGRRLGWGEVEVRVAEWAAVAEWEASETVLPALKPFPPPPLQRDD